MPRKAGVRKRSARLPARKEGVEGHAAPALAVETVKVFRNGQLLDVPKAEIEAEDRAEQERLAAITATERGSRDPNAPFICERADDETMLRLAAMAGVTVGDLQRRRHVPGDADPDCPTLAPPGRRRCWSCPWWNHHPEELPF